MKLLIIEDENDLREVLVKALSKDGHVIEAEGNGMDGLIRALQQDYDLILLDVMLPEVDGWEILRRLRQKKATPVLMLTAKSTAEDKIRGLDLGSDDYVCKPFDLEVLKARIRALLRRCQGAANPKVLLNEDLEYDGNLRQVSRGGKVIDLTPKELHLLEVFIQRSGKILSRDLLAELLFADEGEGESNQVEVYIYNLRKKVGRGLIKNRRGIGYTLSI